MSFMRSFGWAATGAAATGAVLVASPGTYAWLRRVSGRETDRDYYEAPYEAPASTAAGDEHPETDAEELRLSLRARLADDPTDEFAAVDEDAAPATPPAGDAVAKARAKVRAKARAARDRIATPDDPDAERA